VPGKDGARADVIAKYEGWLAQQPRLLAQLIAFAAVSSFVGARRNAVTAILVRLAKHQRCATLENDDNRLTGREAVSTDAGNPFLQT